MPFFLFVFLCLGCIDHPKVPCDALLEVVVRLKMNCDYNKRSNFNFVCLSSLINGRFFYAVW